MPNKRDNIRLSGTDHFGGRMMEASGHEVTQLLKAWSEGDATALEKIMPLVYQELHRMARRYMADERPGHTLQATALVHEAYVRLVDTAQVSFENRAHFFAVCAQVMRRILVDWARSRQAQKRGGEVLPLELDKALGVGEERGRDLVALDDALKALSAQDARKGQVVELRFFGGLSVEETAAVLKVSPETVMRDWKLAQSWLRRELRREAPSGA
jgi:RNA polymerase sigma factor (TIGR02999 family)